MKKIIGILVILTFVTFSCSEDDNKASIVGTWDRNQSGTISTDGTVTDITNHIHNCPTEKDNFTFAANGGFVIETLNNNAVSTTEKSTESNTCSSEISTGNFTIVNDNDLYTAYTKGETVGNGNYEIISLTNSELKLQLKNIPSSESKQGIIVDNYFTLTRR